MCMAMLFSETHAATEGKPKVPPDNSHKRRSPRLFQSTSWVGSLTFGVAFDIFVGFASLFDVLTDVATFMCDHPSSVFQTLPPVC